ncbi:hypothetical protein CcI49_17170 [Frankia sp. CcI49]|uniref:hypothetical protein n=1 Tax=Frankia sp. CcI49 TaxID=1745382 RepID=UPI000975FACA|nr:hypothetical protein [Frankia sp. CcI49]ONH59672.1 hypothetical protein CcI49_17170 [Frankia sp. CcI49]
MEITAFVVSIISLLVAVASAAYARQMARSDKERRRDERHPAFVGEIEMEEEGSWHSHLRLRLTSPWPLARLTVSIVEGHGVEFAPDQDGIIPTSSAPHLALDHGTLSTGDRMDWRVRVLADRSEEIRLRVIGSDSDGRKWETAVYVATPPQLSQIF